MKWLIVIMLAAVGLATAAQAYPLPVEVENEDAAQTEIWREDVPLSAELQTALLDVCEAEGIDPLVMLGLIEAESCFCEDAVSRSGDFGLCQLNSMYFPSASMTPEENIRAGVSLLGRHLRAYGNIASALTAYHVGHDDGSRVYAAVVLDNAAGWGWTGA